MSRVSLSDLAYDIEQMYINGWSANKIAEVLNCDIKLVQNWLTEMGVADSPQEEEIYSPYHGA